MFLTPEFAAEVAGAAREIVAQLRTPEFARHARTAIPAGLDVPDETPHPLFMQVDFGICEDPAGTGRLTPRLIELQGFPSLYAFQPYLAAMPARRRFRPCRRTGSRISPGWTSRGYFELLRRVDRRGARPGKRHPAGDRTGAAEDADRLRLHRDATRRAGGGRERDHQARAAAFLPARRPRGADRAHLQPAHLRRIAAPAGSAAGVPICRTTWTWNGPGIRTGISA